MIFEYDNIVVGSSLDAIMFAARNFYPAIFSDLQRPFRFDYLPADLDISGLNLPFEQKTLTTFDGDRAIGIPKSVLWERMIFLMSMGGYVPLSNLCSSLRLSDHKITCSNEYSKIAEIRFKNCYYFGDTNVSGAGVEKVLDNDEYICYDWIAFNKGGKHDIDFLETSDDFVKRVWFYSSDRVDGNTAVKDACVLSILKKDQLIDFTYSETMARFKLISEMENRGMKGPSNGYSKNGKPVHYKFKTSNIRREKFYNAKSTKIDAEGVIMPTKRDRKDLYKNLSQVCMGHSRFLRGAK